MTQAVKKNGVNFGIIMGIILILIYAVIYAVDLSLFTSGWITLINLIVVIGLGIMAVAKSKSAMGGFISFKEAFTAFFITIVIGFVLHTIFMALLFNVIDPEAKETVKELAIKSIAETMQNFGADAEATRAAIEPMQEEDMFGIGKQLQGLLFSILGYSIIGLIVAAIMKKNKPEFE